MRRLTAALTALLVAGSMAAEPLCTCLCQDDIARVAYTAATSLPGEPPAAPWDSLDAQGQCPWVSAIAGLEDGLEPAPGSCSEALFQAVAVWLLENWR